MSGFMQALPQVLKYEGGYVNDPADPGGATNKGITTAVYNRYRDGLRKPRRSVALITDAEVNAIYFTNYWHAGHCDALPWPLSFAHFDACVNTGLSQAMKLLQRALKVPDDGIWGPGTAGAVEASSLDGVLPSMLLERLRFYDLLVQQKPPLEKFFRGWVNRVLKLHQATKGDV